MNSRPPVGFVVEGHGEFACYPSLFCRTVKISGLYAPAVNAGGCGSIVSNLGEHLTDLVSSRFPVSVIVTIDLQDALDQQLARDSVELLDLLNSEIQKWQEKAVSDSRCHPLPESIVAVLQVRKFESWLISDTVSLKASNILNSEAPDITDAESVESPCRFLQKHLIISGDSKNPKTAKIIVSKIVPDKMRVNSRSFAIFYNESKTAYELWISKGFDLN
ncbi:MAG: DUF4276 family protein [Porticoccaceae bacterium]|nr:DUF4276 family protein [Porticoccaceae bacterium]